MAGAQTNFLLPNSYIFRLARLIQEKRGTYRDNKPVYTSTGLNYHTRTQRVGRGGEGTICSSPPPVSAPRHAGFRESTCENSCAVGAIFFSSLQIFATVVAKEPRRDLKARGKLCKSSAYTASHRQKPDRSQREFNSEKEPA